MSTPVTYELSSEAKNIATFATSSGRPRRPSNVLPSITAAHSGSFSCSRVWLVSIRPGEIELARIPAPLSQQDDRSEDGTSSISEAISQPDGDLAGHVVVSASKSVAFI